MRLELNAVIVEIARLLLHVAVSPHLDPKKNVDHDAPEARPCVFRPLTMITILKERGYLSIAKQLASYCRYLPNK
jgi:hypothetical protein